MKIYSSEEEQLEALAGWWRQWRWFIVGALSAAGLATGAWLAWGDYSQEQLAEVYERHGEVMEIATELAEDLYQGELSKITGGNDDKSEEDLAEEEAERQKRFDEAFEITEALLQSHPYAGYTWLASTQLAGVALQMGRAEEAESMLVAGARATEDFWRGDKLFNGMFRLHLARLMMAQERLDEAAEALDADSLEAYRMLKMDLQGDILAKQGDLPGAKVAWKEARRLMEAEPDEEQNEFFVSLLNVKIGSWSELLDFDLDGEAREEWLKKNDGPKPIILQQGQPLNLDINDLQGGSSAAAPAEPAAASAESAAAPAESAAASASAAQPTPVEISLPAIQLQGGLPFNIDLGNLRVPASSSADGESGN